MAQPAEPGECGLTPRSSGAPTAGHQAREAGTLYIFCIAGLASYRCRPLSSNVRRHTFDRRCAFNTSSFTKEQLSKALSERVGYRARRPKISERIYC